MTPNEIRRRILKWSAPVVIVVVLPAHAQMSPLPHDPPHDPHCNKFHPEICEHSGDEEEAEKVEK